MLKTEQYMRRPFYIEAVQVTEENMAEVAKWCTGQIMVKPASKLRPASEYIKVRVNNPMNDRQTQAFAGDWVLYAGIGYKVYTNHAFEKSFQKVVPEHTALDGWQEESYSATAVVTDPNAHEMPAGDFVHYGEAKHKAEVDVSQEESAREIPAEHGEAMYRGLALDPWVVQDAQGNPIKHTKDFKVEYEEVEVGSLYEEPCD